MRLSLFACTAAAAIAAATAAYAQTGPLQTAPGGPGAAPTVDPTASPSAAAAPDQPTAVDTVVVVAGRTAEPRDQVAGSVTVLDLPTIRASQAVAVSDLLAQTPGVTIARTGGVGETTGLSIRGAGTDETVVLIDGVKVNDPASPAAGFDFGNLLVGDIARIEVLRGPQSTLYGSQAMGGVVNIVTAEPTGTLSGDAQVEGGSYGTGYARGGIGGRIDRLSYRLGALYYATDGISAFDRRLGGREPDGFHQVGASGRVSYDFTPELQLDLRGYYTYQHNSFDGFPPPNYVFADDKEYGRTRQYVGYAGLNASTFQGRLKNRVAVQYTDTNRQSYDPNQSPTETFTGVGRNTRFEYQGNLEIVQGWRAVFGAEHERTTLTTASPAFFEPTSKAAADLDSGYAQLQAEVLRGLTLTGGVRHDSHSTFGDHDNGQVGAAWILDGGDTVLRASWGQGFKAPSLYQLYSSFGNGGLRPESAEGWDAGVEHRFWDRRGLASIAYFGRDSDNLIGFADCTSQPSPLCGDGRFGYYVNIAKTHAEGIELQGSVKPTDALTLSGEYTYTRAQDRSSGSATLGRDLVRRPRDAASTTATYAWPGGLSTAVAVRYAGRSFDDSANTLRLKSYTLVDLRAVYPINATFELYGRIENLFDKAYETAYQYGQLGRGAYVGVRARF